MPRVFFSSHLNKHVPAETSDVEGSTVREALERAFAGQPALRGYVLDDQGAVRKHVMIFVDDRYLTDRTHLSDRVGVNSEIYVMQALSGG
jgi:hypothetical protein